MCGKHGRIPAHRHSWHCLQAHTKHGLEALPAVTCIASTGGHQGGFVHVLRVHAPQGHLERMLTGNASDLGAVLAGVREHHDEIISALEGEPEAAASLADSGVLNALQVDISVRRTTLRCLVCGSARLEATLLPSRVAFAVPRHLLRRACQETDGLPTASRGSRTPA